MPPPQQGGSSGGGSSSGATRRIAVSPGCALAALTGVIAAAALCTAYSSLVALRPSRRGLVPIHSKTASPALRRLPPPGDGDVPLTDEDVSPSEGAGGNTPASWAAAANVADGAQPRNSPDARLRYLWDCMDATLLPDCRPAAAARTTVLPFDEWRAHARAVLDATRPWTKLPPEVFAPRAYNLSRFAGPWVESDWIAYFTDESRVETFYPLVPIFAQWTDALHGGAPRRHDELLEAVFGPPDGGGGGVLRPDVLYVTLMSYDRVREDQRRPCSAWRNVLILSSAGWGNVAIPHLKGELATNFATMYPPPPERDPVHYYPRKFASAYVGGNTFGRGRLWALTAQPPSPLPQDWVIQLVDQQWRWMLHGALWALAPRGVDRGSWRLGEVLQYGRVPLLLHTDVPWTPYQHSYDFLEPAKVPARHAPGGERDVSALGAVLRAAAEAPPALNATAHPERDAGEAFWGALVTPGAMWGPGGLGFALHFDELPAFWCVACEFLKPGSAARWRGVRTLPLGAYGTKPGQACPCASPAQWAQVADAAMGARGNWSVHPTSLLYEMERRVHALVPRYFTPRAVIEQVERFIAAPADAELRCVPRPAAAQPPS